MPLVEAALAFAITMLALSLVVSSFVELVHRIFSMREAGLKYMLGQMFDQVLAKYVVPGLETMARQASPGIANAVLNDQVQQMLASERASFVDRMSANRVPMGVTPKATPADPPARTASNAKRAFSLWSGRDLATLTPTQFMERLGSIDVGVEINRANAAANAAAAAAGAAVGAATDAVLKDVAQKFDAFGNEAGQYFEGRARLLSVAVAIALAFAAHVDAVDLFRTYLRDPNARAKVIEQSQAVTEQYKSAQQAAEAVKKLVPDANAAPADVKAEVEKLQKDWQAAIGDANATVKQYADLGVPLGWNDDRLRAARAVALLWTCKELRDGDTARFGTLQQDCKPDDKGYKGIEGQQYENVYLDGLRDPGTLFFLLLGGFLIGLGSPFWYDVVTGLTSLRNAAGGKGGTAAPAQPPAVVAAVPAAANPEAGKAQPVTPVGVFQVSNAAR